MTIESLDEEIRAGTQNAEASDEGEDETSEEDEADKTKDLMRARAEILGDVDQAHQAALVALDFVSLLLSKDTPVQASQTISVLLRERAGLGTLAADKVVGARETDALKKMNRRVVKGWKVESLNKSVDSILESATRLEKGIDKETKYWEQVLAVSEKGWAVAKMPQERHTLGVRFGFPESASAFKNRSMAALRSHPDGTVFLDQGTADSRPKVVRVRMQRNGIDSSYLELPKPLLEDAPIEDVILQVRDTIFEEELWQELNREARILLNYDVRAAGHEIKWPIDSSRTIVLDLVNLDDEDLTPTSPPSTVDNNFAEAVSIALRLLLSYAHRQNYRRRSEAPPPISGQKRTTQPYSLLRPIILRLLHQSAEADMNTLLSCITSTLISAGYTPPATSYIVNPTTSVASSSFSSPNSAAQGNANISPESLIERLISSLDGEATLHLPPHHTLTIRFRTLAQPYISTSYLVALTPANDPTSSGWQPPGPMATFSELQTYLLYAASCAVCTSFVTPLPATTNGTNVISQAGASMQALKLGSPPTKGAGATGKSENGGLNGLLETPLIAPGTQGWYLTAQSNLLRKSYETEWVTKNLAIEMQKPGLLRAGWWLDGMAARKGGSRVWEAGHMGEESLRDYVEEVGKWEVSK